MSCEICGRSSCCKSFHSIDEQNQFDTIADEVKDRARQIISNAVNSVNGEYNENDIYMIDLDDALKAIEDADL